jgi:hypothetical protein
MKYVLTIILILIPLTAYADQPRHQGIFTSANDKYELRLTEIFTKWSLIEKETNKEIYKLEANISSMTVLVSDDGKSVIAVDDYSEQEREENPKILLFFRNGKEIKSYNLKDLISDKKFVSYSASHFRWIIRSESSLKIEDSKIKLKTHEFYNYSFNIDTGELVQKERDELLTGDAIFAYGSVSGDGGKEHQFRIECIIYGKIPKNGIVKFESEKIRFDGGSFYQTLLIKNGKLIENYEIIMNNCFNVKSQRQTK